MDTKLKMLWFIIYNIRVIYCIQIEFDFEVYEMMVIFRVFTPFYFCFVHMYWRNIPPPSSGGIEPVQVDLP